jgi:hypothetical protein
VERAITQRYRHSTPEKGLIAGRNCFGRVQMRLVVAFPLFSADNLKTVEETQFGEPMGLCEALAVTGIYVPSLHGSRLAASEIRAEILKT